MFILQSPANAGVRTVAGLWKFKNKKKHEDGIDFNELCAVGSKIAAGSRGFPGNLYAIKAGLSDDDEMAFGFKYQPGPTEQDLPVGDFEQQFADFFSMHTEAYLGWEIISDETPQVEMKPAPLPRSNNDWNNLPLAVYSNDEAIDGNEILNAWGFGAWGRELPSDVGDYVGWQRVGLPQGWVILLESDGLILVDNYNQIRGFIKDTFEKPSNHVIDLTNSNAEGQEKKGPKPRTKKPYLQLNTSVSFKSSFSLADYGPYDYWVENASGERLFGIYRQPVMDDDCNERLPKLRHRVYAWLEEHYPEWRDHNAYWDVFPQAHAKWAEARQVAYVVAAQILEGKTDEDLHELRAEIGVGEQRADYTLALQERLCKHFDEKPPFRVAEAVVYKMMDIFDMKIGRLDN